MIAKRERTLNLRPNTKSGQAMGVTISNGGQENSWQISHYVFHMQPSIPVALTLFPPVTTCVVCFLIFFICFLGGLLAKNIDPD